MTPSIHNFKAKSFLLGLVAVAAPFGVYFISKSFLRYLRLPTAEKKRIVRSRPEADERNRILILYGTVTGTAKFFAEDLCRKLERSGAGSKYSIYVCNVKDYDEEQLDKEDVVFFVCSTWSGGKAPEGAERFLSWLKDYVYDFRVSKNHLSAVKFAVFGLGSAVYAEHYATVAKECHEYFVELGATPLSPVTVGDDQNDLDAVFNRWTSAMVGKMMKAAGIVNPKPYPSNESEDSSVQTGTGSKKLNEKKGRGNAFMNQQKLVKAEANGTVAEKSPTVSNGSECCGGGGKDASTSGGCCSAPASALASEGSGAVDTTVAELLPPEDDDEEEEDRINNRFVTADSDDEGDNENNAANNTGGAMSTGSEGKSRDGGKYEDPEHGLVDMEDMGKSMSPSMVESLREEQEQGQGEEAGAGREMVTKLQRRALTKEGYRIIGSHSAVKLCRWTKNQMRGRGGCYKHTFYGITSYQCMEATPSLACANKCVFCWRHHKNPVGTEWRWKTDDPGMIVEEAVELHRAMINEMKGVPGVQPERLKEANTVKHCALSLVGEPIMYPRINEMLKELHDRDISSFLVTNAQFPECITSLDPVTQLYVSVDASTRDSLKAIDRPLFKDFWERFLASLKAMRDKKQRTVYRLTLVKEWNMKEADGYLGLIELGQPDFIEIKSVTYCGKSDASSLTMQNVPWHHECCQFSEAIANRLAERGISARYSIATEHEHSCCVLLAREDKFKVNGVWHTWIDYSRFHELVRAYHASGGVKTFSSQDYMAPTPEWALYQSKERGFDPIENRWRRNKAGALVPIEYKSSESGCG